MTKDPTIYDVSEKAGVSVATVSRVLNNPGKVSEKTRKAVQAVIEELDYKPLIEVRLRSVKKTQRICVCAPHFTSYSYVQRLRGIAATVEAENDFDLLISSVSSRAQLDRFVETAELKNLSGIIFLSTQLADEQIDRIMKAGIKTVLIEQDSDLTNSIIIDDYQGGRMAAEYLLSKGYDSLGLCCEPNYYEYCVHSMEPRLLGFKDFLQEKGISIDKSFIYEERLQLNATKDLFMKTFASKSYPRAIFATADIMAMGIVQAARESGLSVPDDIAVIGFDDLDFASVMGLTTISQHLDDSGVIAAKILLGSIRHPEQTVQKVKLGLKLIERQSA